ncbi:MAG TPA: DNA repair ATPase [Anaerohalosphaeraceae bacterium]|jgi:MoxR-like ATPase|nr:DNA repair ATPase [Anaerohalosphaeraceae bacterium]HRT50149.1 DNA repair ATPase [Anaerohalosphaeraceae bacterium]HRT86083.1 DNA repair ATPase [Anaerohalosphaeraceae bacterium]
MVENNETTPMPHDNAADAALQGGAYEVIRKRLETHGRELRQRMVKLNAARKDVFGAIESRLIAAERVTTSNNCIPRDMIPVGDRFIFGYNVFVGLRTETTLADVFSIYRLVDGQFVECPLELIEDERFIADFKNLFKYYRHTTFAKFAIRGPHLFMVFSIGKSAADIKTFKWLITEGRLRYLDNRSDHELVYPAQHQFEWIRTTQDMHRSGLNPHISIEERVFVETIGGDLTIKIEDNTETGQGIYSEPVDDPDQTLIDAEIYYAIIGNIILLKIRPYQEENFRYIVYSEKTRRAVRIDSIKDACVLLPQGQGLVFPRGYYLQTGETRQFETNVTNMVFEKCIASPNGEDFLYLFYNHENGVYLLLPYNLIEQSMSTPLICNGFSVFDDGTLICLRAGSEPQKHHAVQIWKTPYYGPDHTIEVLKDAPLYKIGNTAIVRCMAECTELLNLLAKDESYANLYVDIARKAQDICDSYFWLGDAEVFNLAEPLGNIQKAASAAIEEFEKVVRTRRNTQNEIDAAARQVTEAIAAIDYDALNNIDLYVNHLAQLRALRGRVVSLKDLRYADLETVEKLETEVAQHTDRLSSLCIRFLLDPEALAPYRRRIDEQSAQVDKTQKVTEARELSERVDETAAQLEMLTEIVSNLKIEDATQTVAVIDNISLVYSRLNQVRSALKNRINELGTVEGQAEFAAQIKLLDQSVINYLDVCDTPEKCDEYLTKITVQLETLESRFADFDEFIGRLTEKREELYNAFESRKVQIVAHRNQRASALMAAAERVLKGIENRLRSFSDINEINGYFASDLMVQRVHDAVEQLLELGDTVKAEDIRTRLKALQQDAVRQLKDRQALFVDGDNIIRLGRHRFRVNRQPLEGTIVRRGDKMFYHLTGTGFFEEITDEALLAARDAWDLEVPSESPEVYRAEYLAYLMLQDASVDAQSLAAAEFEQVLARVQAFMGPRYEEGYIKGVHDHDAARILQSLVQMRAEIGLLRYPTQARALAAAFWMLSDEVDAKARLASRIAAAGRIRELFDDSAIESLYVSQLTDLLSTFVDETGVFDSKWIAPAAEYLFCELANPDDSGFAVSRIAVDIRAAFEDHLRKRRFVQRFAQADNALSGDPLGRLRLLTDWVGAFLRTSDGAKLEYADEVAVLMLDEKAQNRPVIDKPIERQLSGILGSHPRIVQAGLELNYCDFMTRLNHHAQHIVPRFVEFRRIKQDLVEQYAERLRLDEFKPRVLSTFVRNKLIDKVYLPLIGDNLAKQIGSADETKRTDTQGLLLLISPPGYGKTTLMEYMANRLGLTFMKINGPAIGSHVTALDPATAPNSAAREELQKLNLAFEMGDNVMIYIDDIQHTNPEFLQKFISLCDAQRRIEGVFGGRPRTYDLRGKRVCAVMAGNPYTESGEKFKIPDMLANRADTYNIGDIVGDNREEFVSSYVENCLTSNPVLQSLAMRSQKDVYTVMKIAETGRQDNMEFEANYSADELDEYVATMKKLFVVREVLLKVNQQYIASAGQNDAYRTEPPFLLQGSYRNMNRIAARVLPVMNDDELWTLIVSSYEQDAQTLTTGAEANMLKFRELIGHLTDEQARRWSDIKKTFTRNLLLGADTDDRVGKIIGQLNAFSAGLDGIRDVLAEGIAAARHKEENACRQQAEDAARQVEKSSRDDAVQILGRQVLDRLGEVIAALKERQKAQQDQEQTAEIRRHDENTRMLVTVLEEQFKTMETWLIPVHHSDADRRAYFQHLVGRFQEMVDGYTRLIEALRNKYEPLLRSEAPVYPTSKDEQPKSSPPPKRNQNKSKDNPKKQ